MTIRFQILDAGGTMLGSSGEQPFQLQPNDGRLPPKLVSAIFSMQTGQVEKVPLKAADAFGELDPQKRFPLDPSGFKEKPQVGMAVQLQSKTGEPMQAKIVEVTDNGVIADANHPLAGKDLVFAITVLEGGSAPADSTQPTPPPADSSAPGTSGPSAGGSPPPEQSSTALPFAGSQALNSDREELPRTPPPTPEPGMETVGFLDTSGYNIIGL